MPLSEQVIVLLVVPSENWYPELHEAAHFQLLELKPTLPLAGAAGSPHVALTVQYNNKKRHTLQYIESLNETNS